MYIKKSQFLFPTLMLFLVGVSCTRPAKDLSDTERTQGIKHDFIQGVSDDLYNIEHFQVVDLDKKTIDQQALKDKAITIKTSKQGELVKTSTSEEGSTSIDPESNISFAKQYQLLDYEVVNDETSIKKQLANLLGKVEDFKGFPETEYQIIPHLLNNYLILYRLSDSDTLPYDEKTIAIKLENGKLLTPLVGYPVEYCVAEVILNVNQEKTGKYRSNCGEVNPEKAEYAQLRKSRKHVFRYLPKVDIFPSDFFDGEWFYAKSIIKSSQDRATGFHLNFESAYLIEFVKSSGNLEITDTSSYELADKDKETRLSIPVEWTDYELDRDSEIIYRFEERLNTKKKDIERPYFKIKFLQLAEEEQYGDVEVDNIFITDDYFSFTIKNSGRKTWTKYAFKKRKQGSNYVEKKWFETDSALFFPAFADIRKYYRKAVERSQEDRDRYLRTTRFNPRPSLEDIEAGASKDVKIIKWYFSKQTPKDEWIRDLGRKAVQYWDAVFQKAGENSDYKIRIVLDESKDYELGDIRHNIINLMVTSGDSAGGLLGLGPNISNPITGEIISATSNVWVTNVINTYIATLKRYIRFQVYPPAWKILPESPGVSDFFHQKIQKLCPEVQDFIAEEKTKGLELSPNNPPLKDNKIVEKCAAKISRVDILSTILHEMGHGFSYRHVFSASADRPNFYQSYSEVKEIFGEDVITDAVNEDSIPAQYSSVMDYPHAQQPQLTVPGKYDIAITRFIYFNQIEKTDGSFITVPAGADNDSNNPQQSIQATLAALSVDQDTEIKKYKVCGGKKVDTINSDMNVDDPLCSRFDYGTTPRELIEVLIRDQYDIIMRNRNRYDYEFKSPDIDQANRNLLTKMNPLMNKWLEYQIILLKKEGLKRFQYSFTQPEHIEQYQKLIQEEARINPDFKAYQDILEPLYRYLKKMFFLPVKHCVYRKEDGSYKAIPLETIESFVQELESRELFVNCKSPVVQQWALENLKGAELITELGYFGTAKKYVLGSKEEDPVDEISVFDMQVSNFPVLTRAGASTHRMPVWYASLELLVGLLGDPTIALDISEGIKNYILEGQDLNPYINKISSKTLAEGQEIDPLLIKDSGVNLPPTLSYGVDYKTVNARGRDPRTGVIFTNPYGLIHWKFNFLNTLQVVYQEAGDGAVKEELTKKFDIDIFNKTELADIISNTISLSDNTIYPFMHAIYEQYQTEVQAGTVDEKTTSFITFLLNRPEICVENQLAIIPRYSSEEGNIFVDICKRFNKYRQCLADKLSSCEDAVQKEAFVDWIQSSFRQR